MANKLDSTSYLNKIAWRWRGMVAIILALGSSIALILLIVETILHVGSVTSQEATVISTSLGAMIGAVAVYLGGHTQDQPADKEQAVKLDSPPDDSES